MVRQAHSLHKCMPLKVAHELDQYSGALLSLPHNVVWTDRGFGPNIVRAQTWGGLTLVSALVQFPMLGRTTVADDAIIMALLKDAPPTNQSCGIEVKPKSMLLYGPKTEHAAITPAGPSSASALISVQVLEESAERRGVEFSAPERGGVHALNPTPELVPVARLLRTIGNPAAEDEGPGSRDDIVLAAEMLLSGCYKAGRGAGRRVVDSETIVNSCIGRVETIWDQSISASSLRTPSITERCSVAFVSERRLRNASYEAFGVAPLRHFRLRSMTRVRDESRLGNGSSYLVLRVMRGLGYSNVRHFASYDKDVFDESPSMTAAIA